MASEAKAEVPTTATVDLSSFKVYTKTGDDGSSCLYNMERRNKDDAIFEALGDVDELNVAVGIARTFAEEVGAGQDAEGDSSRPVPGKDPELIARLAEIQSRLLDVGSAVATPLDKSSESKKKRVEFDEAHVDGLEAWIDEYTELLPPLKNFILPSGGKTAAFLHLARTVCRRAERRVVPLVRDEYCPKVIA
mmetsp:Transcript_44390/g.71233  ORF Transcript_44390/g.71233 Transcript_44390/m.71233 type:complete len:192 (+) Transcript_44390:216-791(+)